MTAEPLLPPLPEGEFTARHRRIVGVRRAFSGGLAAVDALWSTLPESLVTARMRVEPGELCAVVDRSAGSVLLGVELAPEAPLPADMELLTLPARCCVALGAASQAEALGELHGQPVLVLARGGRSWAFLLSTAASAGKAR